MKSKILDTIENPSQVYLKYNSSQEEKTKDQYNKFGGVGRVI